MAVAECVPTGRVQTAKYTSNIYLTRLLISMFYGLYSSGPGYLRKLMLRSKKMLSFTLPDVSLVNHAVSGQRLPHMFLYSDPYVASTSDVSELLSIENYIFDD